jgi:MoaA/NifB/PqqE/SkfB family radical SAM enzyme
MSEIKTRTFKESNYHSVYYNGKTLRIAIDAKKPITELEYPEFYDVKITNKCLGACPQCYQNSVSDEVNYVGVVQKFKDFFGVLDKNQRPFQIAYGGGEPTLQPEFCELMKVTKEYGITPNYTTNGMHVDDEIISITKRYCGGVALSCHPHLEKYWRAAFDKFKEAGIITNFHLIISDNESIDRFVEIYKEYKGRTDYFVLLPLIAQGRAKNSDIKFDEEYFAATLKKLQKEFSSISDIAFGANFYNFLVKNDKKLKLNTSLYTPEIMSKYLDFKDMKLYPSSFNIDKPLN